MEESNKFATHTYKRHQNMFQANNVHMNYYDEEDEDEDEESEDDQENEQNDQYVEEVEITNLRGEVERIHVNDIKPVSAELAKQLIV